MKAPTSPRSFAIPALLLAFVAFVSSSSPAAGGVFEIDQQCALSGGCFPGDGSGFPVTINQPGSYRLTSNLDVRGLATPQDVTAIQIQAPGVDVEIDLNGFALLGPNTCAGPPANCTNNGAGYGVTSGASGTEVRDGSVIGFGADGLSIIGDSARVERVHAWWNGQSGIRTWGESTVVVDSAAWRNGEDGLHTYRYTTVTGFTAAQNGHYGAYTEQVGTIAESIAWGNGATGFAKDVDLSLRFSLSNSNMGSGLTGHVVACVSGANIGYGLTSGLGNETSALQSVFYANVSGSFAPGVVVSLGQNACNGAAC
jgi:hypothetical protein